MAVIKIYILYSVIIQPARIIVTASQMQDASSGSTDSLLYHCLQLLVRITRQDVIIGGSGNKWPQVFQGTTLPQP